MQMIASPSPTLFDLIDQPAAFAVQFIDPVTFDVVSQGIVVSATGIEGDPIQGGSGRFIWMGPAPVVPATITVSATAGNGFSSWTYSAADIAAGISPAPSEWGLCRLFLRTAASYTFPSGVTVVCGRLRLVPDVLNQPPQVLAGAQVWLQWQDASKNPATAQLGLRSMGGPNGDFAASLLFPLKSTKSYPQTAANGDLVLTLYVARPGPAAGWTQAHTAAGVISGARVGQLVTLAAPIAWSTLTAG